MKKEAKQAKPQTSMTLNGKFLLSEVKERKKGSEARTVQITPKQ
jgi:hypothetical protein